MRPDDATPFLTYLKADPCAPASATAHAKEGGYVHGRANTWNNRPVYMCVARVEASACALPKASPQAVHEGNLFAVCDALAVSLLAMD